MMFVYVLDQPRVRKCKQEWQLWSMQSCDGIYKEHTENDLADPAPTGNEWAAQFNLNMVSTHWNTILVDLLVHRCKFMTNSIWNENNLDNANWRTRVLWRLCPYQAVLGTVGASTLLVLPRHWVIPRLLLPVMTRDVEPPAFLKSLIGKGASS